MTMWYFTDRQEPVLMVQHGMDYHATALLTGRDSGVVFRKDTDARGYTIEARLPWRRLGVKPGQVPPQAGDRTAVTFQPLWSNTTGEKQILTYNEVERAHGFHYQSDVNWGQLDFSPTGHLPPAQRSVAPGHVLEPLAVEVPLVDPEARSLSAALWNADGELVRTLPTVGPSSLTARKALVRWDGSDDDGQPLPAGNYTVKYLTHRGVAEKWVTSVHSAGDPPWKTDDGHGAWGGDHGRPVTAAAAGGCVYLGWEFSEAGFATVALQEKLKPGGKPAKLWGQQNVLDVGIVSAALASNGEAVFVGQDGKRYGEGNKKDAPNRAGIVLWDTKTGSARNFPFGQRILEVCLWQGEAREGQAEQGLNLSGLAVSGDRLFASLHQDGKVILFNWRTGQRLKEFAIVAPRGLAVEASGNVVVASRNRLVRLDPTTGATATLADGLSAPIGVAVDRAGAIYVSDQGAAMQVKVFGPDGKPLRAIGKPGGRLALGRFDPQGMLNPNGIAVDAEGKLWVTERDNTPRRVSVWDSQTGRLLADLLGPGHYAINGGADESRPAWVNTHHTLFEVDYASGAARTLATLVRPRTGQYGVDGDSRDLAFRHVKGRTYLVHAGRGILTIFLFDPATMTAQPVAGLSGRTAHRLAGVVPEMFPERQRAEAKKKVGDERKFHVWADRNGDRRIQLDEWDAAEMAGGMWGQWGLYWGSWVDDDLTIWSATPGHTGCIWRVPVEEWLPDGTPVYPSASRQQPLFSTRYKSSISSVMPSPDGRSVYVIEQEGGNTQTGGGRAAVSRYAVDGHRLWSYRKTWANFALDAPLFRPGCVIGAMKFCGRGEASTEKGPVPLVMVNGYHGQFNLLTADGLWVAALASDNRFSPAMSEHTFYCENFSGFFYKHRDNGKHYYIAGETDTRIMEVTGLETIRTGSVALVLTERDAAQAREVAARRPATAAAVKPLVIRAAVPRLRGEPADWKFDEHAAFDAGAGRKARFALAHDAESLYAAFDVKDDSPMKNAGSDFALLFKTGDTCELMLATDPTADPRRKRPVAGDARILMTEMSGQLVAVLYQPAARAGLKREPRVFASPTGSETFDRVVRLPEARLALKRRADGYLLEAAIPLASLGMKLEKGAALRGDVGVLFSTPGGNAVGRRAYLFNQDTQITQDVPSEARLQPANWGSIRVE